MPPFFKKIFSKKQINCIKPFRQSCKRGGSDSKQNTEYVSLFQLAINYFIQQHHISFVSEAIACKFIITNATCCGHVNSVS